MEKNLFQVQQMFAHLLPKGEVMQVVVLPPKEGENTVRVRSNGGCFGILAEGYNFEEGTVITAEIVDNQNGVVVFAPTKEWQKTKLPQKARVLFVTPKGVAMELVDEPGNYVSFNRILPAELTNIKEGQVVMVAGMSPLENGYETNSISPYEEKLTVAEEAETAWGEDKIAEAVNQGSRKCFGKAKLGKTCIVDVIDSQKAQMANGQVVKLRKGFFPPKAKRALVRVIFITMQNDVLVKLLKTESAPVAEPQVLRIADCQAVGYRNDDVRNAALETGSLWQAGPYKLGYNYKVKIEDNVPFFEPSKEYPKYPVGIVNVVIDDRCQTSFADGDEVICTINYIHRDGDDVYTFKVSVLKVL